MKASSASTWTTFSNIATNTFNLTGLTPGTSYDFHVESNCPLGSTSGYSTPTTFSTVSAGGYCTSSGQSTAYEFINRVAVGSSGNTSGNNNGYGNFTTVTAPLKAGKTYSLKLTPGFTSSSYSENWTVYIDYDRNGSLSDVGELVGTAISSDTTPVTVKFTVPATAKNGRALMRIQMSYGTAITDPCAAFTYGEVEDYTANLSGGTGLEIVSKEVTPNILSVVPNPVKGYAATVNLDLQKQGSVNIRVTDLSGRLLLSQSVNNASAGKMRLHCVA